MTALLTLEREKLSTTVTTIRYRAAPAESVIGLRAGERMTVADLMRGLLLASANDAAATLAVRVGGTRERFVRLMNDRARQLGLHDTHYSNPIGLDQEGNHSSAEDLVKLTLILRRNAFFRAVTNLPSATLKTGARPRTIANRNTLVRTVRAVNGVKTGHTSTAGYVLVGSAHAQRHHGRLGRPRRSQRGGARRRLAHAAPLRPRPLPQARGDGEGARVRDGEARPPRQARELRRDPDRPAHGPPRRALPRCGSSATPREIDGPLPAGARVGTIEVRWRGKPIDRVALVTDRAVSGATVVQRAGGLIGRTLIVLLVAGVALGSLQVVLLRRRMQRRRRGRAGGTEIA